MSSISNDRFGVTFFLDADGTQRFSRNSAENATEKIGALTVNTHTANWYNKRAFTDHRVSATTSASGTGACAR